MVIKFSNTHLEALAKDEPVQGHFYVEKDIEDFTKNARYE